MIRRGGLNRSENLVSAGWNAIAREVDWKYSSLSVLDVILNERWSRSSFESRQRWEKLLGGLMRMMLWCFMSYSRD